MKSFISLLFLLCFSCCCAFSQTSGTYAPDSSVLSIIGFKARITGKQTASYTLGYPLRNGVKTLQIDIRGGMIGRKERSAADSGRMVVTIFGKRFTQWVSSQAGVYFSMQIPAAAAKKNRKIVLQWLGGDGKGRTFWWDSVDIRMERE